MTLRPLTSTLDRSEPSVRVSRNKVTFNAAAVRLLSLSEGGYVQFKVDADEEMRGRTRIYVGRTANGSKAWRLSSRRDRSTLDAQSRRLCALLSESLEGPGVYRICPEERVDDAFGTWYGLFHKRYDC